MTDCTGTKGRSLFFTERGQRSGHKEIQDMAPDAVWSWSRSDLRLSRVARVELGFHHGFIWVGVGVRVEEWIGKAGHRDEGGCGRSGGVRSGGAVSGHAAQVAGVSAWRLDMRICELLLLRMDSCVPPFTPLLASEGCRCFRSTAKYLFTVQLRHFLLISDCTLRYILHKVIINGPRWKETSSLSLSLTLALSVLSLRLCISTGRHSFLKKGELVETQFLARS